MISNFPSLTQRLKQPEWRVNLTPFISLGLILILFLFAGNSFLVSHGTIIDLKDSSQSGSEQSPRPPDAVLTLYSSDAFFFEGHILSIYTLGDEVSQFVKQLESQDVFLLIRVSQTLTMEQIAPVLDLLKRAGVQRIILENRISMGSPAQE